MNEREYFRLRKQIHDEHKKKLEALDLVWSMANACQPPKVVRPHVRPASTEAADGSIDQESHRRITAYVEESIAAQLDQFSTKDVCDWIERKYGVGIAKRSTVSHTLKRMKGIEMVEVGKGKRPSVYRKVAPKENLHGTTDEFATIINEIREIAKEKEVNASEFQRDVLIAKYGVKKLVELNHDQALEVLDEIKNM